MPTPICAVSHNRMTALEPLKETGKPFCGGKKRSPRLKPSNGKTLMGPSLVSFSKIQYVRIMVNTDGYHPSATFIIYNPSSRPLFMHRCMKEVPAGRCLPPPSFCPPLSCRTGVWRKRRSGHRHKICVENDFFVRFVFFICIPVVILSYEKFGG